MNAVNQGLLNEFGNLKEKVKDLENLRIQLKEFEKDKLKSKDKDKERRVMTSRRDFSYLPKYSGKHEEFEDWKFKVKAFSSEEKEFKEFFLEIEKHTETPKDDEILKIVDGVHAESGEGKDPAWLNHQLFHVLCLNLKGKALAMVNNLQ